MVDPDAVFAFVDDPDEVPADATPVRHARDRSVLIGLISGYGRVA